MENLSPELWSQAERQDRCDAESPTPRAGEILRAIGLVLMAHLAFVVLVLLSLKSFGIE